MGDAHGLGESILVLFGGGDGGGFWITSSGVKAVPPFTPKTISALKAAGALANAAAMNREEAGGTLLAEMATSAHEFAIRSITSAIGESMGSVGTIIFQGDGDDGFCATPPHGPHPLPGLERAARVSDARAQKLVHV